MLHTASLTLLSLIGSVVLALLGLGSPLAVAHLAFAVGIVSLIFAAMSHFVPVLTRTGDPGRGIVHLPAAAQLAGVLAVCAMQGLVPRWALQIAAAVDLVLAATLLSWITGRVRATLGSPHPGWRWYGAALGCLMLALLAALLMPLWTNYWQALRIFHLHLNALGLVGLAAISTLLVLVPTAMGSPDPDAAGWLRRRLFLTSLSLIDQWSRRYGFRRLLADGVAASLLLAPLGLLLTIMAGVTHGAGLTPARPTLLAWFAAFLLPLVSGALSQLLPVWRWPGPVTPARLAMRQMLAAGGTWRAALWFAAAIALLAGYEQLAAIMLGAGLLLFVLALLRAATVSTTQGSSAAARSTR